MSSEQWRDGRVGELAKRAGVSPAAAGTGLLRAGPDAPDYFVNPSSLFAAIANALV
jgi:hypothetical protein